MAKDISRAGCVVTLIALLAVISGCAGLAAAPDIIPQGSLPRATPVIPVAGSPRVPSGWGQVSVPKSEGPFARPSASCSSNSLPELSPVLPPLSGVEIPHKVQLSWIPSEGAVGYCVYRGTVPGGPYAPVTSLAIAASFIEDILVRSGKRYYYVVTAEDAFGDESAFSEEAVAVIPFP